MFLLYIEANSVSNSKGQKSQTAEDGSQHGTLMEFSLKDLYAIQEIQAEENLLKLIVKYVLVTQGFATDVHGSMLLVTCQRN